MKPYKKLLTATLGCLLFASCGCGGARYVMRNQDYGVVAIPNNYNSWPLKYRESAEELMAEHFPAGYVIDHEEEYIVGQTTQFDESHQDDVEVLGGAITLTSGNTAGTVTTKDETEYRIHYRRR